MSGRTMG